MAGWGRVIGVEFAEVVRRRRMVRDYDPDRPVSPEALAAAEIDVVLVPRHALEALSGREGVLQQPGLALTRAAREQRLVVMDGLYLLGFGPRLGQAVQDLARLLHPQAFTAGQSHDRAR